MKPSEGSDMNETIETITGPARYEQEVRLTVRIAVTGDHEEFEEVHTDRLRLAIEQAVQRFLPPVFLDAVVDITATNLAGSSRYVFPGEDKPTRKGDIVLPLDEVLAR